MNEENNEDRLISPDNENGRLVMNESPSEVHHSHLGPILGVLVLILALVLGGLYLWGGTIVKNEAEIVVPRTIENNEPETPRATADAQIMDTVSTSDEIEAIEADLESTNLDDLDSDLDEIERELDAALNI